ncbi:uncharacterized protein LOC113371050 [Ctenocephalides felis]|uniref:uncharacterized protein LOC113371050 n=1 Tax=Ctenocephalides felis TaxID=7515 RepID=UPI000E6E29AE|nr:uncharacterized protein LOC113371050 [Ctenocephalides felis]
MCAPSSRLVAQYNESFATALIKRCFRCRSRGDLGSCRDPFTFNATQVEDEKGVEAVPCASGWCGKILEGGNSFKDDEYGKATQRMCLQRGPDDGEDRCAYTVWNYKKVYMCFCQGDLCNSSSKVQLNNYIIYGLSLATLLLQAPLYIK